MTNTEYDRGDSYKAAMAVYLREISQDNTDQHTRLRRNLIRALQEEVTPRQRQTLLLYYGERLTMQQIGEELGVDKSTVCRTIKRGERRLRRCLRYGADRLLEPAK